MSSCIVVLYTTVLALTGSGWAQNATPEQTRPGEADRLYASRGAGTEARRAAELWSAALARNGQDFESAWKLARACYWLGSHLKGDELRVQFERGMAAAQAAIRIAPNKPDGHFWLAATMAGLAESQGMRAGLHYRTPIRESLEKVLQIDPGVPARIGRPRAGPLVLQGAGTLRRQQERVGITPPHVAHLQPSDTASWYFLAETLIALDRKTDARAALQKVIDAPFDPEWTPEDREWKEKASQKLNELH